MYIIISITNDALTRLCMRNTTFLQMIYVIRSKTNKYIPFANNGENDYI